MDEKTSPETSLPAIPYSSDPTRDGQAKAKPRRTRSKTPEAEQRQLKALEDGKNTTRARNIKNRNNYAAQWMALKTMEPKLTFPEAAARLGLNVHTLKSYIYKASKDGHLKFDDSMQRIEYEIIPKVMDNLKEFLDKKDRTVTLETAKGTVFKQFQAAQGIQDGGNMVLALKIETQPAEEVRTVAGVIVGTPKRIEE